MKEENKDFEKQIYKALGKHQKEINELSKKVDTLEKWKEYQEKYKDISTERE